MESVVLTDSMTKSMSDEEFFRFCMENPQLRIERNNNLQVVIMPPVSALSSYSSGQAFVQLSNWNSSGGNGIVFDSSAGFTLPDRSVLSPDASWISIQKWNALSDEEKNSFTPVCPDFVIEVRSKSDSLSQLKAKMAIWQKNGVELGWLIDPIERRAIIYQQGMREAEHSGFDSSLIGVRPVEGFELKLSQLIMH